ncbi:MAG: hypothetical protein V4712_08795 [Pseudomonadota bacterium]
MIKLAAAVVVVALAGTAPSLAGEEAAGASPSVFVPAFAGIAGVSPAQRARAATVPATVPVQVELPGEAEVFSNSNTNRVVRILNSGQAFCASLADEAYAIDCLAERMEAAAAAMPETGDYADARAALLQGAARLNALAVANADPALPRATARQAGGDGIRTSRPLVPVRKDKLAEVAVQAQQIVTETETLLLRSSEASSARKVHYSRISAAVGSNKVLLRSI